MITKRGSILFISLWTISLLTIFSIALGYQVRQKLTLAQRLDEKSKLHFIGQAAVMKAVVGLKNEEQKAFDALADLWSNNPAVFSQVPIGEGKVDISYDYIDEKTGNPQTQYGLIDEERKININKVKMPVLERLLRLVAGLGETGAQELAASIVDWRDADSLVSIPVGSAEDIDYRNLSVPYEARDQDFEVLDELLLVNGMNQDIFEKIKDYVTIYGGGTVNINTASRPVLLALGLDEAIVDDVIFFRSGEDGVIATIDDNIFDLPANIIPKFSQVYPLSAGQLTIFSAVVEQSLTTSSKNFMIKAVAKLDNKKDTVKVDCVTDRTGKILYWRES